MTEADINPNPIYIRDFLGHTDLSVKMERRVYDKLKGTNVIPKRHKKAGLKIKISWIG